MWQRSKTSAWLKSLQTGKSPLNTMLSEVGQQGKVACSREQQPCAYSLAWRFHLLCSIAHTHTQYSHQHLVVPSKSLTSRVWQQLEKDSSCLFSNGAVEIVVPVWRRETIKYHLFIDFPSTPILLTHHPTWVKKQSQKFKSYCFHNSMVKHCTNPINKFSSVQQKWPKPIPSAPFLSNAIDKNKISNKDTCWRF